VKPITPKTSDGLLEDEWQPDAHGDERQGARVAVEHVRRDRDLEQDEVGQQRGQVAGERAGRVADRGGHVGDGGRPGATISRIAPDRSSPSPD
jgi:hypothetical protein